MCLSEKRWCDRVAREFAKKFYKSKEWLECRAFVVTRDKGLCQECLKKGKYTPGEEVHHIIWLKPTNINDPNITLNPNNLELVCKDCHFAIHKTARHVLNKRLPSISNGTYFDDMGNLQKVKIYIVYGPPAGGKTTYVKEHMEYGDMIVDLDSIKQSLSLCYDKEQPDNLTDIAKDIRDLLYVKIRNKEVNARNIWVIATLPRRKERQSLRQDLDAKMVFIDTDIDECIANAMNDKQRKDKSSQIELINNWFGSYEQ